jgi:hypothetical protein
MSEKAVPCSKCGNLVVVSAGPFAASEAFAICAECSGASMIEEGGRLVEMASPIAGSAFTIKRIKVTAGASTALADSEQTSVEFLTRHAAGDWGDSAESDLAEDDDDGDEDESDAAMFNDYVSKGRGMVMSNFKTRRGVKIWVMTTLGSREPTTVLLPGEH